VAALWFGHPVVLHHRRECSQHGHPLRLLTGDDGREQTPLNPGTAAVPRRSAARRQSDRPDVGA
jgi:hypothetical protein